MSEFVKKHGIPRRLLPAVVAMLVVFLLVSLVQAFVSWRIRHEIQLMAQTLQMEVGLDSTSVRLLRLSPELSVSGLSVAYPEDADNALLENTQVSVELSWLQLLRDFRTIPAVQVHQARLNLQVDTAEQNNWDEAISRYLRSKHPDDPVYTVGHVDVQNVEIEYINDALNQLGSFAVSGSATPDILAGETVLKARGDINYLPVSVELHLSKEATSTLSAVLDLAVRFDDVNLEVAATVIPSAALPELRGDVTLEGGDLTSTLEKLGLQRLGFEEAAIEAAFAYRKPVLEIDLPRIRAGRSSLSAHVVVQHDDTRFHPERVSVELVSEVVHLDELLNLTAENLPMDDGSPSSQPIASSEAASSRLFSEEPFELAPWMESVELDANVNIRSIYQGALHIPSLQLTARKSGSESLVSMNTHHSAGGELRVEMAVDHAGGGATGSLAINSDRTPLMDFLTLASVPESMASGKVSGSAKLWFDGASSAEIAASLDGGLFVMVEDGKLDSLLVEMAGIDLMESMNLVIRKDLQQTDIRCGFVDLHVKDGLLALEDFVVDTEDSVFVASGNVDLGKELLDLRFTPHPHDASFFAATTSFKVGGTFMSPRVRPGNKLYSRLALATAMAALTGPAAFVLPFIEVGDGGTKSYCSELFAQ